MCIRDRTISAVGGVDVASWSAQPGDVQVRLQRFTDGAWRPVTFWLTSNTLSHRIASVPGARYRLLSRRGTQEVVGTEVSP